VKNLFTVLSSDQTAKMMVKIDWPRS